MGARSKEKSGLVPNQISNPYKLGLQLFEFLSFRQITDGRLKINKIPYTEDIFNNHSSM